jgi:hypothetical protein
VAVRADVSDLRAAVTERAAVAAELRFALADLDAQRADQLVPGNAADDPAVTVGNRLLALITAQQRRTEISSLARRLGADPAQADRVHSLLDALGRYDDMSGRSGYVDEQRLDRPVGHPPEQAVGLSAEAGNIMHDELLPTAAALSSTYQAQAARLQRTAHDAALLAAAAVGGLGLAALGVLLWWQRDLARRYRRLLNPALLAATAAVAAVTLAGTLSFSSAADGVDDAARDGLSPWSRLAEARAVAADAAAAQSRWLVDGASGDSTLRTRFTTLTGRLDTLLTPGAYATPAERPAYQDVLTRYGHFKADDRMLRTLMAHGDIDRAAVVLTEIGRGQVGFDFWDFTTRLAALAERQRADFDTRVGSARADLDAWPAVPAGALGAAAVLVLMGVRPRLAEYR